MRHTKIAASVLLATSALAAFTTSAAADVPPTADSPGCAGLIAAELNHAAGGYGATDNPKSSSGPGYTYGPGTVDAIHRVRGVYCP